MNKQPSFQFYPADWLKDSELLLCSSSTRGVWMDLLCRMHESGRSGIVTGTVEQLCRLWSATPAEITLALDELNQTRTATVSQRNGVYTIINRQMKEDADIRRADAERQPRSRSLKSKSRSGHADVAPKNDNGHSTVIPAKVIDNKEDIGSVMPLSQQCHDPSSSSITKTQSACARDNLPEHVLPDNLSDYRKQLEAWYTQVYGVPSFPPDKNTEPQLKWLFDGKFTLADIKAFYEYATTHPDQTKWRKGSVSLGAIVKGIGDWRTQSKSIESDLIDYSKCPDCHGSRDD